MPKISPQAVIDPKAQIADDVEIGPFCVIGPDVSIGQGCRLVNSVTVMGHTSIGPENVFYPNVVIGGPPQDKGYKGDPTRVEIGQNNLFRESVTVHRGTVKGGGITRVGNGNYFMVNSHLGHDVQIGSQCILANNVMIAGHVIVGDKVNMSGGVGVHHFVTIGELAFIGGYSRIHHDVPPYFKVDGADQVRGVNVVGMRRSGFIDDDIDALEDVCRRLFYTDERPFAAVMAEFDTLNGLRPCVKRVIEFLRQRDRGRHGRYLEGRRVKS